MAAKGLVEQLYICRLLSKLKSYFQHHLSLFQGFHIEIEMLARLSVLSVLWLFSLFFFVLSNGEQNEPSLENRQISLGLNKAFFSNPTDDCVSIPSYHMVMIMFIITIKNIMQFYIFAFEYNITWEIITVWKKFRSYCNTTTPSMDISVPDHTRIWTLRVLVRSGRTRMVRPYEYTHTVDHTV